MIAGKFHARDVVERKMLLASWLTKQPQGEANRVYKTLRHLEPDQSPAAWKVRSTPVHALYSKLC